MVDISAEHSWGRVAETFGEEPQLAARLAGRGGGCRRPTARGLPKHFVGYGLAPAERDYETVSVGMNTLRNLHLRPFQAAVRAGCRR